MGIGLLNAVIIATDLSSLGKVIKGNFALLTATATQ